MDSRKSSVRHLAEKLHSLLGLKAHLTSNWVKSVCEIIKTIPSEKSSSPSSSRTILGPCNTLSSDEDYDLSGSDSAISQIRDQVAALNNYISQLVVERRQFLNDFLDLKGNIRVFCRIRPIAFGENLGRLRPVVGLDSSNVLLQPADTNKSKSYSFDRVFPPASLQEEVFSEVEPIIKSVIDGYNACIFAYGQTGTGKTYTMEGRPDAPGLVPRAMESLFKQAGDGIHGLHISFSMLEIYLGNLRDLLVPKPTKATDPEPPCLTIQTDPKGGIEIDKLVAIQVNDFNQALKLYRLGCSFRSTASTKSNVTSSRSHCMIRLEISCFNAPGRQREKNKMWLVDLGGSERVLKTKAWGKRLDEGKAINLSLSALGDVIYALQRKKRHVPYRNSKLTQVLKDSLGGDSKTLMLVHISPREEDLCETICSLNFATRVKSIHLGQENSIEVKEQKEVAIANLQQKMEGIEDERICVRRKIEKLNKKLEKLTGTNLSSEEQLDIYSFSAEESLSKNSAAVTTAAPSSELPRFMKPTICSLRKFGATYQISEQTYPIHARRRRPSSHRAESVTFPVKDHSEYNSECNISRSSCLAGLNMKKGIDSATEYSLETTETFVTTATSVQEHKREPRPSNSQKAGIIHLGKEKTTRTNKTDHIKLFNVDKWLHREKNKPTVRGHTNAINRVLTAPNLETRDNCSGCMKADRSFDKKVNTYAPMVEGTNPEKIYKQIAETDVEILRSEEVMDEPVTMLKDLFGEDSRSDSISPLWIIDSKTVVQSIDCSSIEDNGWGCCSSSNGCCLEHDRYQGDHGDKAMSIAQALDKEVDCSKGFPQRKSGCFVHSPTCLDSHLINSKGKSGATISISELRSCCQQRVPPEVDEDEDYGMQNYDATSQAQELAKVTRIRPLPLRSRKALFANAANQTDVTMPFANHTGKTQTTGIRHAVRQKTEMLCASVLLGLGFYNLGLEHDFFFGLML